MVKQQPKEMHGLIYKKSPTLLVGWQERYWVLKDRKLKYYKSKSKEDQAIPQGVFNFDHFLVTVEETGDSHFDLTILGIEDRVFHLKTKTSEAAKEWQDELNRHIGSSEGFKEQRSAAGLKQPWRFDNISESQFIS